MLGFLLETVLGAACIADSVVEEVTGVSPIDAAATGAAATAAVLCAACNEKKCSCKCKEK